MESPETPLIQRVNVLNQFFQADNKKAATNLKKHGVTFSEAATVFGDPLEITIADPEHSEEEFRFLSIGRSEAKNKKQFVTIKE